jgi:Carboxypeptidase regulatory-like domain/TonB dependent receptor
MSVSCLSALKRVSQAICVALLLFWLSSPARVAGQTFSGSVIGLVTDASGSAIPGARVVLTDVGTGVQRSQDTNSTGNYTFAELSAGVYGVRVTKTGFKEAVSKEITLTPGATMRSDAALAVGDVTETVQISAQPPTLNTDNAELGSILTHDEVLDLPLNSLAGPMNYRYLSSSNYQGGYIAGQRSSFGFYSIDGVSAMAPAWGAWSGPGMSISLEAVQDITQVTSTPSAEFGDVATISVSTKSGTNNLHGSGFWDTRNYALDADGYFSHSKGKGPYSQYLGGSLGGPVYIPHVYDGRNRTFFFFDWESFIQPGSYTNLASVPTSAMRSGDFSALLTQGVTIYDPTTGQPFPNNVIPASRISPVSSKIQDIKYIPSANFGPADSFSNNFLDSFPNAHPDYYPTTRVDHNFRNGKDVISARHIFRHQNEDTNTNGLPLYNWIQNRNTTNAFVSETHLFSPTVVNEFRVGYSRDFQLRHATMKGADVINDWGLQLPHLDALKDFYGFPQVNFQNFTGLTDDSNNGWAQDSFEYIDNLTLSRGKHTIKVGGSYRHYKVNETGGNASQLFGHTDFTSFGTQAPDGSNGFDYASFLLGIPFTSGTSDRPQNVIVRYGNTAVYLQEDWRATSKLTLNFGLRWEKTTTPVDQNDMRYAFDPSTGNLVVPTQKVIDTLVSPVFPKNIPIVTAAQAGFPSRSLVSADQNWGPRVGFAYRLPHNAVIRGGSGIFYTPLLTWAVIDSYAGGPFQLSQTFQNRMVNGAPAFQFPNPYTLFGSGDFAGVGVGGLQKNVRTPYTEQWNLTLEKELGSSMVARVNYRGHHTLETLYYADLNQPHVSNDPNNEWNVVYPNFWNADVGRNGGSEIGHLLEFQIQRKYSKGLSFDVGYTHAKVVTDLRGSDIMGWPEYSWDINRDSGNENGIPRHRFVGSAIWDIPFGTGKRFGASLPKWLQYSVGNWETSYILVLQSGFFLDPSCSGCPDTSYARVWGRPDLVGNPTLSNPSASQWFNPSAFAVPAYGTLGDSAPGVIVGPGLANLNFGLFKYFPIHEKVRLKMSMTATNFFNHPNLGRPNTDISSINAGLITGLSTTGAVNNSGNGMRSIMLGARIDF